MNSILTKAETKAAKNRYNIALSSGLTTATSVSKWMDELVQPEMDKKQIAMARSWLAEDVANLKDRRDSISAKLLSMTSGDLTNLEASVDATLSAVTP
jgi:hypothetical protein